jgi:hypothetical protein
MRKSLSVCHRSLIGVIGVALLTTTLSMPSARAGGMPALQIHHRGVTVIEPDKKSNVVFDAKSGFASPTGSVVASTELKGPETSLTVRDGVTGVIRWESKVPGSWRVEAVSVDGKQVLLGDPAASQRLADVPNGRQTTTLSYANSDGSLSVALLPGNFIAEAISADNSTAVMLEFLPAEKPTQYRVVPLDLASGRLGQQAGAWKRVRRGANSPSRASNQSVPARTLDEEIMRGTRLGHSWGSDGTRLYTLYDASTPEATAVFVHSLDLTAVTAACLAVPEEIDAGQGRGSVVAVNIGTDPAVAVVGRAGAVVLDASTGRELARTKFQLQNRPVLAAGKGLWIGDGKTMYRYDLPSLRTQTHETFKLPAAIVAIASLPYGPAAVLDRNRTLWFAGTGVPQPVRRGAVPRLEGDEVTLVFPGGFR